MSDLVARLRDWRSLHLTRLGALFDEAADEIERLRSRPCPYVTGGVTQHCTLTPVTLTDEEREAVEAILVDADSAWSADNAAALRGLLERTQFAKRESDRPQPIAKRESDRPQPIAKRESDRPQPIADARLAARLAALQQLAELDEELGLPRCTPNPLATPGECSVPPECTDTGEAR